MDDGAITLPTSETAIQQKDQKRILKGQRVITDERKKYDDTVDNKAMMAISKVDVRTKRTKSQFSLEWNLE